MGALKPWARVVITAWVLTVVPVMAAVLGLLVLTLPRIVGTALASAEAQREALVAAAGAGDVLDLLARAVSLLVVLLPVVAIAYLLARLARRLGGETLRRTRGRPVRRGAAALVAVALVAGLAWSWWPSEERYRPVQAYERGTITDAVALARPPTGFSVGNEGSGTVVLPAGADLPTRSDPQLAAVLVPHEGGTQSSTVATGTADADTSDPTAGSDPDETAPDSSPGDLQNGEVAEAPEGTWVFPFDEPLAPDEGDTQAMAVTTTDGTATYDVAFALIWADGSEPVDTTNEAYAFASCSECVAVAISFQVVLVIGEGAPLAPQNIAAAVNYDCSSCLSYALAVQLFVTLDGPLSDAAMSDLEDLWAEMLEYAEDIGEVPLDEMQDQLSDFEGQILDIVEADQGPLTPQPTTSQSSSPTGSVSPSGSPSSSPTNSPDPSSEPNEPSATPSAGATTVAPTPTTTPSQSTPSASPGSSTPTPTGSPAATP